MVIAPTSSDWRNVVAARRRALRISQAELGATIGMSRQWVVGFESGKATGSASLDAVLALCSALDLDPYLDEFSDAN